MAQAERAVKLDRILHPANVFGPSKLPILPKEGMICDAVCGTQANPGALPLILLQSHSRILFFFHDTHQQGT